MNHAGLPLLLTSLWLGSGSASGQTLQSPPVTGHWIVSETTSPVDYSPIVIATTKAKQSTEGFRPELSIYCRGGNTYLVVSGNNISARADDYRLSYSVNGDRSTQAGAAVSLFGGVAMSGDIVSLLQSLPGEGEISISTHDANRRNSRRNFPVGWAENRKRQVSQSVQLAAKRCQAAQLTV